MFYIESDIFHDILVDMHSVLVQFDDATFQKMNQAVPPSKRKRAEFIREAVKEALHKKEFANMRQAYLKQPDSATDGDDWANCEEFKP
jgi:hypothetical protein